MNAQRRQIRQQFFDILIEINAVGLGRFSEAQADRIFSRIIVNFDAPVVKKSPQTFGPAKSIVRCFRQGTFSEERRRIDPLEECFHDGLGML